MDLILFYDTETSGLPIWSMPSEDPCQPHITQIAAELCDEANGNTLDRMSVIIQPDGWTIPDDIAELTGITTERATAEGIPIGLALAQFISMWRKAALRAGHNESFDMRMVRIELMRSPDHGHEFADEWKASPSFCTQSKSTKIINLPPTEKMLAAGRKHAKSPNLAEAYRHFTGTELVGAHDAAVDVLGAKTVYYGIRALNAKAAA